MTTTIASSAGKTTITIKFAAPNAAMTAMLDSIVQALYEQIERWWTGTTPIPTYEKLTTSQKLSLTDAYVKHMLVSLHKQQLVEVAQRTARITAEATDTVVLE